MAVHSTGYRGPLPASVRDARLHVSSLHMSSYQNTTATGFSYCHCAARALFSDLLWMLKILLRKSYFSIYLEFITGLFKSDLQLHFQTQQCHVWLNILPLNKTNYFTLLHLVYYHNYNITVKQLKCQITTVWRKKTKCSSTWEKLDLGLPVHQHS